MEQIFYSAKSMKDKIQETTVVNVSFLWKNSGSLNFHVSTLRIIPMDRKLFLVTELYRFIWLSLMLVGHFLCQSWKIRRKRAFLDYILQQITNYHCLEGSADYLAALRSWVVFLLCSYAYSSPKTHQINIFFCPCVQHTDNLFGQSKDKEI